MVVFFQVGLSHFASNSLTVSRFSIKLGWIHYQ